jgi:hypothetical protein
MPERKDVTPLQFLSGFSIRLLYNQMSESLRMKNKASIFVWVGILLAVAALVIPHFSDARFNQGAAAWANRLRLIDSAKNEWALERNKQTNDVPTWSDLTVYIDQPSMLFSNFTYTNGRFVSGTGEFYTIDRIDEPATCYKDGKILKLQ